MLQIVLLAIIERRQVTMKDKLNGHLHDHMQRNG
jgi:hypothetical protein